MNSIKKTIEFSKMIDQKYTTIKCRNCHSKLAIPNEKYKNHFKITCPNCNKKTPI